MRQYDFTTEWPKILVAATAAGVDPFFVAAIRVAENGVQGREFGVLSEEAPDYAAQLRVACASVRNELFRYGFTAFNYNRRVCYTKSYVETFAKRWAPPKAPNDPTNLNANWAENAWDTYLAFVDEGGPIPWQAAKEKV